jgi:hypothetical protein
MEIHPKISQEKLSATLQQSTTKKILGTNRCCNKNWINCNCIFKCILYIFIYVFLKELLVIVFISFLGHLFL